MFEKLQAIEKRYEKLMVLISDPAVQADQQEYRTHAKAVSEIQPIVEKFKEYSPLDSPRLWIEPVWKK